MCVSSIKITQMLTFIHSQPVLHNFWFRKLPQHIREGLFNVCPSLFVRPCLFADSDVLFMTVPRCFMIWWFFWSNLDPVQFPMPTFISNRFPRYEPDDDDAKIQALLVDANDNLKQTEVGNLLEEAWEKIDDTDRLLMMVCWAARQEDRNIRNMFAHPTKSRADANLIISSDLSLRQGDVTGSVADTTRNLLARAQALINKYSLNV
jgi:hypothetical protein